MLGQFKTYSTGDEARAVAIESELLDGERHAGGFVDSGLAVCYILRSYEPSKSPHRLVWPRTPAFQAGNTGSNPVGDAT